MKYLPGDFHVIKDNLFAPRSYFELIQEASHSDNREMYQVFNMGHRLEIFTDLAAAEALIKAGQAFNIEAKIVGHAEAAGKEPYDQSGEEEIVY